LIPYGQDDLLPAVPEVQEHFKVCQIANGIR